MFTLTQVQYIFDYAMLSFYQYAEKTRPEAVNRSAQVAAAATTMVNKEANMAVKTKHTVLTAGLEAVISNEHLKGEAHRAAFDIQFAISLKTGLEKLFCVESISEYDKANDNVPTLPVVEVKLEVFSSLEEPKTLCKPSFFSTRLN
ncbi:hypothetical protein [Legionella fairfieldensis]|uniref:hypothetical protein n=1 Tax=Legionella fairfieldensis TaxID=45064 RepID=UPI0004916887|nr:hypothetical protein [Legionella fairfieldensis]